MSASCFIRSISNDSCCLVLSTSSWVCWVTVSIFAVSALCQHIYTFSVTTHSQVQHQTSPDWSEVGLYLPKQFGMAGHQLCVLLLQLVVPLLSGLRSFCTTKRDDSVNVCTWTHIVSACERVYRLHGVLSASMKVVCRLSCSALRRRVASSSMRSCSFSTRARCFWARCSSSSASKLLIWDLSCVM